MVLRSDEMANQSEIERDQRFRSNVNRGITTAASIGAASIASPLASKIMPFINQYIPAALAMKGINKVSPKLGSFLKKGQEMGLDVEEGLKFIKDKFGAEKEKEPAKQNKNIIEQESPELFQFLDQHIRSGKTPLQAAALASLDTGNVSAGVGRKNFKEKISKLIKTHKIDFPSLVESIFGKGDMALPQQGQQQQPQEQPQQPQQGQGLDPGVAQIMQQGAQILQRFKGQGQ